MIVVDTDVLIDALSGREPALSRVAAGLEQGVLATTSVTVFELLSGARDMEQRAAIEALLDALPVYDFDRPAGEAAARFRQELEAGGQTIGMGDYLIAGICSARSTPLLTRNRKHFQRIPSLVFADL